MPRNTQIGLLRSRQDWLYSTLTIQTVSGLNKKVKQAMQKIGADDTHKEIKGYQFTTCLGSAGCPNRIDGGAELAIRLAALLKAADLPGLLRSRVGSALKMHHELRITLAECPNACSQPQIKDIGIIAACRPYITAAACSGCAACRQTCREAAIQIDSDGPRPILDLSRCCACGQCLRVCPSGTLAAAVQGYRVMLGGKLGRHPRLAHELPGIYTADTVLTIVQACLELYRQRNRHGERLGVLLNDNDFAAIGRRFAAFDLTALNG